MIDDEPQTGEDAGTGAAGAAKAPTPDNAAAAAAQVEKDKAAAKDAEADDEKLPPYTVKAGKSVTSKKGILSDGAEVKAEFFDGGMTTIKDLVKRKVVVKN